MNINLFTRITAVSLTAMLFSSLSNASIMFAFTESGGNVLMQSSGTLDTSNLLSVTPEGWGGAGIESNGVPDSDIMGDNSMGDVDVAFGFNAGTDFTPWIGNMFTNDIFGWSSTGTTQFTTYIMDPNRVPGIGISSADLIGDLWTSDVSWSKAGTLASFGMTIGTYTVSDVVTNESITIQIGDVSPVPEPTSLALLGLGLAGFGFSRKKKKT